METMSIHFDGAYKEFSSGASTNSLPQMEVDIVIWKFDPGYFKIWLYHLSTISLLSKVLHTNVVPIFYKNK